MHTILFIFILLFSSLFAENPYENGKSLYKEKGCGGCHGMRLEGINRYPYLANRQKGFLMYKLKRFRARHSDNQQQEMMIPFAMHLSDKEIDNLTTYMYEYVDKENTQRYDDSYEVYGDGGS